MSPSGRRHRTMQHLATTILFVALVIAINVGDGASADETGDTADQVAEETGARTRSVTILEPPKYVNSSNTTAESKQPDQRPPSKPPIPDKQFKKIKLYTITQPYYAPIIQNVANPYPVQNTMILSPQVQSQHPNAAPGVHYTQNLNKPRYKYQQVIPLKQRPFYQPLLFAASTGKPYIMTAKSPKFSLPVQTVNGIRTEFVRPPKSVTKQARAINQTISTTTTTNTTTTTTTTRKPLRNKRIWPKHILDKMTSKENFTTTNKTATTNNTERYNATTNSDDLDNAQSIIRVRFTNRTFITTTVGPSTTRGYRRVTRIPKHKFTTTTPAPFNSNLTFEPNDWVPIVPSHYSVKKRPGRIKITHTSNRRMDYYPMHEDDEYLDQYVTPSQDRRTMYLQSYGLIPIQKLAPSPRGKKAYFFRKRRQLNPHYSGFSTKPVVRPPRGRYVVEDLHTGESRRPPRARIVTKVKHHHHHHHHKYIKTVEKKVPVKVEVPKPYPVEKKVPVPFPVPKYVHIEKKVPYPITVEKQVPFPIEVKVPMPVPFRVIEKEYIPKPFPVVHHVPFIKHVEVKVPHPVPYPVEKEVQVPVEVKVPVDRPVPYRVEVEKRVPYPVPVKVFVPQPYPVEKRVPYPVEVKVPEPYEVIRHVPVQVPVPQPFAVKVPHPVRVDVEKKVPYPVEVEKKVPVPFRVYVPHRVEVEKRVPVYVPKPYPVEKKVPVPVKVPYPVNVPIQVPYQVPVGIPVYLHEAEENDLGDYNVEAGLTVSDEGINTSEPPHTVTLHGSSGFQGFSSRSDDNVSTSGEIIDYNANVATTTPKQETTTANTVTGQGKGFTLDDKSDSNDVQHTTTISSTKT